MSNKTKIFLLDCLNYGLGVLLLLMLGAVLAFADAEPAQQAPSTQVDKDALAQYHDVGELVRADLKSLKEECPTCVFLVTTGAVLQPSGEQQDTVAVYVWHPGEQSLFIRARKDGVNILYIFLPAGEKDPTLKKFLAHPPEVSK